MRRETTGSRRRRWTSNGRTRWRPAQILLVETPGGGQDRIDQGLIDGVNYARDQPGVSVVSMSWTEDSLLNIDADFTSPNYDPAQGEYQGITFIAGTGDDGGQAGYPGSSPNVLAVGGTSFAATVDANGDYPPGGETAWSYSSGGIIPGVAQPRGQSAVYPLTGGRATPDVAFDAGTGVVVYDSYDYGTTTPWVQMTGTSIGAPAWSALIALADQGRALLAGQGLPPQDTGSLDGTSQTIPDLYAIAGAGHQSVAFNDVISGQNQQGNAAGSGYDLVTGLGTPKAEALASILSGDVAGPNLQAPRAGSVLTTTDLPFEWSPVPGAVSYNLTVTDTTTGQVAVTQDGLTGTSFAIPSSVSLSSDGYTWDVTAVMADGRTAATAPAPHAFAYLPIPAPTGPSGVVDSTTPILQWAAVPGAAGYDVTLEDVTTGTSVVSGQTVASTSYTPASALNNMDTYAWTVSAISNLTNNGQPDTSPPSGSVYFTVDLDGAPVPISPANQATVTTTTPTFQWSAVAGAVSYSLTIVDVSAYPETTSVVSVSGTSYTPAAALTGYEYWWSVQALLDVGGVTAPGSPSALSVFAISSVGQPTLVSPLPGATVTTATPTLTWSFGNTNIGVYLDVFDTTAGAAVIADLTITFADSYQPQVPLENGHTYEWAVRTSVLGGPFTAGQAGPSAEFTVAIPGGGAQTLAAPTPIAPSGIVNTESPVFQWTAVPGAVEYGVFLDTGSQTGMSPALVVGTTFNLSVFDSLTSSMEYSWQVVAYDSSGNFSPPSTPVDLFCDLASLDSLPAPTDLSPAGTVATYTPTVSWSAVPGATGYLLEVFDETAGVLAASTQVTNPAAAIGGTFGSGEPLVNGHSYRYYVNAIDTTSSLIDGAVATQTFTVSGPPIGVPTQASPAAGSTVATAMPTLQWSAVPDAVSYTLFLLGPDFFSRQSIPGVTGTSYTPTAALLDGITYQWQVAAVVTINGVQTSGPVSSVSEFTISVPGTAILDAKDGSGTVTTTTPTLQWSPVPGAAGYDLFLVDTTNDSQVFNGLPVISTSYAVTVPLNNGDHYQWYVTAYDNYGDIGLAPAPLTFDVAVPPPPPPIVTGPIGQVKSPTTTFQVTSVPGATRYTLYIKDTTTGQLPLGTPAWQINGGSYTLPFPPVAGDTYAWYVSAFDAYGNLLYQSSTNSFVLSTATDLAGPPTLIPFSGPVTAAPTFQWSTVSNAVGYEVEILDITDDATGSLPSLTPVEVTSYTPSSPLAPGQTYQWQVEAFDQNGLVTLWSSPLTFHVPPSAPSPTSPSGTTDLTTPMFQWSPAAGAAGYQFELTDVTGGGDTVVVGPTNVGGTSYTPAGALTVGHTYQWQVLADDSSGADSAWSSPVTFQIVPPPPSLISPAGTTTSTTPTFQWTAAAGAAGYQIEIADVTGGGDAVILAPTKVAVLTYTLAAPLTAGHTYQWQVLAYDSSGADSSWSSPMSFSIPPANSQSNGSSPTPPSVTGLVGVTLAKKKVSAITIAFDEALESASADSIGFYQVAPETKKRKKIVYGKPVKIAVSYDGSHDVTIRLARPVKGPLRLMVLPGIIAADGAAGTQPYTVTID